MSIDHRPTIAAPDDDPYLWLEEIEGERALAFVEQQNALTLREIRRRRICRGSRRAGRYPGPAGQHSLHQPARRASSTISGRMRTIRAACGGEPRWLNFAKPIPAWETILDIDRLAADENEDWLFAGAQALPGSGAAIVSLSRGGSDAAVLREFDVETKAFVAGGFTLPEAKGGVAWIDADTLLLSSAYGEGMATTSGYARTVRLWRRGTDVRQAPVLIETAPEHMSVHASVDRTGATPRIWFGRTARFLQPQYMAWRRKRRTREARYSDRRRAGLPWRLARGEAARAVDGGNADLRARHRAWHVAVAISGGRTRFPDSVRGGTAPRGAALLLGRRPAGDLHSRRIAAGVRGLDAGGRWLDPRQAAWPAARSASPMSGGSTPRKPKATATCSPTSRIR